MTGTFDGNNFGGGAIGAGEILYGTGAGTIGELTLGASSTVLLSNGSAPLWTATSSLGFLNSANIDTCAEVAAIIAGETGSCGSLVLSAAPTFTGNMVFANAVRYEPLIGIPRNRPISDHHNLDSRRYPRGSARYLPIRGILDEPYGKPPQRRSERHHNPYGGRLCRYRYLNTRQPSLGIRRRLDHRDSQHLPPCRHELNQDSKRRTHPRRAWRNWRPHDRCIRYWFRDFDIRSMAS